MNPAWKKSDKTSLKQCSKKKIRWSKMTGFDAEDWVERDVSDKEICYQTFYWLLLDQILEVDACILYS